MDKIKKSWPRGSVVCKYARFYGFLKITKNMTDGPIPDVQVTD
jgi:hypothetical protein